MTISEKYLKVLEIKELTEYRAEVILGFGRNTLTNAIKNNRILTPRFHRDFMEKFHVNPEWWDSGKGEIFHEKLTSVSEADFKIEKGGGDNKPKKIPFYDTVAVGGASLLAEQNPVYDNNAELIDPGTWFRTASGALRVYGHSMFPKYPAGCIVAFKESEKDVLIWGEDYVIELKDRRIVKRVEKSKEVGCISAVSYNKSEEYVYASIDIPITKIKRIFMVMGKVEMEASI